MSEYLGSKFADAVKLPCGAPALDDVLAIDPLDPKKGIWQKAGTNNIANSAVTGSKIASKTLSNEHLTDNVVQGHGLLNKFLGATNPADDAPAGFNMVGGAVFNTDVLKETTNHRAGANALTFRANCPTSYGFESEFIPVREGEFVEGIYGFQASGTTVAAAAVLYFFQRDKSTQVSATDIHRGTAAAASTKYTKRIAGAAPANARFAKLGVTITVQHATQTWTVDTLNIVSTPFGGFTGIMPIGGILAWHKTLAGVPSLPAGWVQCDGQALSDKDSPLDGQTIPDLNGSGGATANRFLRGASTSGTTRVDNVRTHKHDDTFTLPNHTHDVPGRDSGSGGTYQADGASSSGGLGWLSTATSNPNSLPSINGAVENPTGAGTGGTPDETYPRHMDVVWIMRVK